MNVQTRGQKLAQAAFQGIQKRREKLGAKEFKKYETFAKKFPALIHTCGLVQAVAFARAKQENDYLADLAAVLKANGHSAIPDAAALDEQARNQQLIGYLRLSRDAINTAGWLKRYVEAVGEVKDASSA